MKLTIEDGRDSFYTFDTNRILLLTATDEEQINQVEFSTEENGETVSWTSDVLTGEDGIKYVQVPNEFLNGNYSRLVCYGVALDSKGEYTRQKEVFRIRARQEPQDYYLGYSERVTFASIKALTEQYKATTKQYMDTTEGFKNNASNSAGLAKKYAENNEDESVETGTYSAKHWSIKTGKKYDEIKEYVGSASKPTSALGLIESAKQSSLESIDAAKQSSLTAITDKKTESIANIERHTNETAIPSITEHVNSTVIPTLNTYVESAQSAQQGAEMEKTEAESARSGAIEAKNIAVEAKTASETARQGAENARDTAVAAKNSVSTMKTSVEQTVSDFNTLAAEKKAEVESVYQTDLNELKGDLETERNARIEADTDHSRRLHNVELASSVNRYEIENLKAKAEGQIYREEIVDGEAYSLDVPSSVAPYAEVQKIGGKSVVWNQLVQIRNSSYSYKGITFTKQADKTFLANGTSTASDGEYINEGGSLGFKVVKKHKYFIWGSDYGGTTTNCMVVQIKRTNGVYYALKQKSNLGIIYTSTDVDADGDGSVFYFISNGTTLTNVKVSVNVADLTQMFGSGNEPTLEECQKIFSADYYPYDAGTIKSFPVKTVRSLNAERTEIGSIDVSSVTSDFKSAGSVHDEWSDGKKIKRVGERAYTSGDESESGYITDGTTTYYPLATPTEETVPEISNYIQVEGGGTLTFESDDTVHMPVPSTDRFVVDLS